MANIRRRVVGIISLVCLGALAFAQTRETFKARLSPVPMDATMKADVAGLGSATAVLTGTKLSITGSFEGLRSPASAVKIHRSSAAGVRGSAVLDLTISKAASGTITGSLDLTPDQVESLRKGKLYIQIDSVKAADGNLWGWLLP